MVENENVTKILTALPYIYTGTPAQRKEADAFLRQVQESENVHTLAFQLLNHPVVFTQAEAQHFALGLLIRAFRRSWNTQWSAQEKTDAKNLLLQMLPNLAGAQEYVRNKFGDAFVECMKREWPQQWGEALPALLGSPQNPVCYTILRVLAERLVEDNKDLPVKRRKEITGRLMEHSEEFLRFIAGCPDQCEKLRCLRWYTPIYGLTLFLRESVDVMLARSLCEDADVRNEALLVYAEWSTTSLYKFKGCNAGKGNGLLKDPCKTDVERLLVRGLRESLGAAASWAPGSEEDECAVLVLVFWVLNVFIEFFFPLGVFEYFRGN